MDSNQVYSKTTSRRTDQNANLASPDVKVIDPYLIVREDPYVDESGRFRLAEEFSRLLERPLRVGPQVSKDRIESLISELKNTVEFGPGYHHQVFGASFILGSRHSPPKAFVVGHDEQTVSAAFLELVRCGPEAIATLLEYLDDSTPTKITVSHEGLMGFMSMHDCLDWNRMNRVESQVLSTSSMRGSESFSGPHAVTVGDLCFVVLGQIVGRQYQTIYYVPTGCVTVTSPTRSTRLCKELREIWQSSNSRSTLWASLVTDFCTRTTDATDVSGAFEIQSTDRQISAVERMLQYFPNEAPYVIVDRLDGLDVSRYATYLFGRGEEDSASWRKVSHRNGVDVMELLNVLVKTEDPQIRAALQRILSRSDNSEIQKLLGSITGESHVEVP